MVTTGGAVSTGGTTGTGGAEATNCSGITNAGYELCDSGPDFCTAVFTDGSGCETVCAAAGLECTEVWENAADACAADTSMAQLSCSGTGHQSDYCLCTPTGNPGTGGSSGTGGMGNTGGMPTGGAPTGGAPTGGAPTGGAPTGGTLTGGAPTGGAPTGGAPTGGAPPDIRPGPCECESPAGEYGQVDSTIVVGSGQTYDGECQVYRANPSTLGDGSQAEGQSPIFRLEHGATLRNVVIDHSGADGIHLYGDATLENIHWLDIGEDAMTVRGEGSTVHLDCGSSANGDDKTFQVNASSTIYISNFTARNAGKFMRQNGGTTFHIDVYIDHCDISNMNESIFRTDSSSSHVTFTNSRYSNIGDSLFIFGSSYVNGDSAQSTVENIQSY
jgi:hypothetical protein